jgi:succinoglycan biosynthesis protein ExoA
VTVDATGPEGSKRPKVSIVIPTYREVADIADCLSAVATQDYPPELMSVIVVDGCSDDGTPDAAQRALTTMGLNGILVNNPARVTASSLNVGLAWAAGEVLIRLDARSRVQPHYVRTCVDILASRPDVAVVGGAQLASPRRGTALQIGIARALRNRWATGLSRYRRSSLSGPTDTVWMGSFRTRDLRAVGGWDDQVALNEDYELNERLRNTGALVWYDASLRSSYRPRGSIRLLSRQYYRYGTVKGKSWARGRRPSERQTLLLVAPLVFAAVIGTSGVRRGWGRTALLATAALAGIEVLGGQGPAARPLGHLAGGAAIMCVGSSWWTGTIAGFLGERLKMHGQR